MYLTERHVITKNHPEWKKLDYICFISKNLYNYSNYLIKKEFEETGHYLYYHKLEHLLRTTKHENYIELPNNSSQQILLNIHRSYQSFFKALKAWKNDKTKFEGCPRPPKYKHKTKGRNVVPFTYAQVRIKNGYLKFPKKTKLNPLKTKVESDKFKQVRIIPQSSCYIIEVIYKMEEKDYALNKNNFIGIDLGINNLISISNNQPGINPILISGRVVKSINQYYNKKKANVQNQLIKNHNKYTSKKLQKIELNRKHKIQNYFHHVSKFVIDYCIKYDIGNIIIGKNKKWKHECNIGKQNNQKFVQIPYETLINQIKYKAELIGINVKLIEESYTSKCSSLDIEPIKKLTSYVGKRIKRGLFKFSDGLINADTNASLNILRKEIGDDFINLLNRGLVLNPLKVNPLQRKHLKLQLNLI